MVEMLRKLNVTVVKMGVENVGAKFNATSEKDQKTDGIRHAAKLLKDAGIHVVAYLLLGGETSVEEYEETLAFCKEVGFDSYVINVWSYPMDELTTAKYRYDAHFSTEKLKRWEIPMEIVEKYLDLHASKGGNPNLSFFGL
jgi:tRNA A37 methylthiotransferase MiaB